MQWTSYAARDFIPFTQEAYVRLIERVNDAFWPWQLAATVIALATLWGLWQQRLRLATALLSLTWVAVGFGFFNQYYANLNWAGSYFAWACYLQAMLLILCCPPGTGGRPPGRRPHHPANLSYGPPAIGLLLCLSALLWPLIWAFIGWLLELLPGAAATSEPGGHSSAVINWQRGEWLGLFPDSTAVFTLGFLVIAGGRELLNGWRLGVLMLIPLLWCLTSGLTLSVLDLPHRYGLYLAILLTLLAPCLAWLLKPVRPAQH